MENLVSVIVPIYNVEKQLEKCIKSIINQTYKNLEILLINDGSQDNSIHICNEFAQKDNRIKIIDKENEGASAARNLGLDLAKGEYITFIDADDYIASEMIEELLNCAKNDNYDIVISGAKIIDEDTERKCYCYYSEDVIIDKNNKEELIQSLFVDNKDCKFSWVGAPWAKLIKREFIIEKGIKFNTNLIYSEDEALLLALYIEANKIYYLNQNYYYYVRNENSITKKFDSDIIRRLLLSEEYIIGVLKKYDLYKKYEDEINYEIIKVLQKNIIIRYFLNKKNKKNYRELKKEFIELVNNNIMKNALENIDEKRLGFSRKIVVYFSKRKKFVFIWLYYKLYFMIRRNIK